MAPLTFVEKILGAKAGSVVIVQPDLILSHDNTASIERTFASMGGTRVCDPNRLVIALDHNAPPTSAALANDYSNIRTFAREQGIHKFHNAGEGISHQLMSRYARPGMLILGSDSHTCTSGAFNAFAAGIDRTETAGLWLTGETWLRIPETIRVLLHGRLREGVYAKDIGTWLTGILGADGANYYALEFDGEGIASLSMASRMVLTNLVSDMGAKSGAFPCDNVLRSFIGDGDIQGIWADQGAQYAKTIAIDLGKIFPVVACPHSVDNVRAVSEVAGTPIQQVFLGTCSNGRLEDLAVAAAIVEGKQIHPDVRFLVTPASKDVAIEAAKRGYLTTLLTAGAQILSASCGPCLGTGQGIPADDWNVLSTSNRNFKGRMGNGKANVYLGSPATAAATALAGCIADPRGKIHADVYLHRMVVSTISPQQGQRKHGSVWNFSDIADLNTDLMFAGSLTYSVKSSDPASIIQHLFADVVPRFGEQTQEGDIVLAGDNFGCGSSREHPSVGMAFLGIQAIIAKSAARIFYRSAINQGLPLIIQAEAVAAYTPGLTVHVDWEGSNVYVGEKAFSFPPFAPQIRSLLAAGGLKAYLASKMSRKTKA